MCVVQWVTLPVTIAYVTKFVTYYAEGWCTPVLFALPVGDPPRTKNENKRKLS